MTRLARLMAAAALLVAAAPPAPAQQTSRVLLQEGLAAYRDLEFEAASRLFRRALDSRPPLDDRDRTNALMHLGAAEVLLGKRDRAVDAFRDLVLDHPGFRPDSLVFPPRVTLVFGETAQATKGVAVTVPAEHRLAPRDSGLPIIVRATSPHLVVATIVGPRGTLVRRVYDGSVSDSVRIPWDGLDASGTRAAPGRYRLEVASLITPGRALRMVRVPLEITVTRPDTIPWPPRPVPTVHRPDLRFLLPGVAGALVLVLPPVLGTTSVEGPRIALGVAVAAIGTVASLRTSSVPSAEDQRDWRGTVASVREENAGRRARAPMIVRAGRPQRIEAGAR